MKDGIEQSIKMLNTSLRLLKDDIIKQQIENTIKKYSQILFYPKTKVSLCGRFNAGKSALINSMIGDKIVISRPISSTGVITKLYYNRDNTYTLIKKIDGNEKSYSFSSEELKGNTVKDNFNHSDNVRDIVRVDIGLPNELLHCDVELYDTPGLDDVDNNMNEITMHHLDHSDFIIFVVDAMQLKDLKDLLMRYYNRLGRNVLFVANKMDCIEEEKEQQDIINLAKVYYSDYFNPLTYNSDIFFVSAKKHDSQIEALADFCKNNIFAKAKRIAQISRIAILKYEMQTVYNNLQQTISVEANKSHKRDLMDDKRVLSTILIDLKRLVTEYQLY